jgi:putative thioredoxin
VIIDVSEPEFDELVVRASHERPVVVDFWADWCGPCRALAPVLEDAVQALDGAVVLARVDTDANPRVAAQFGVRGIPNVKAFRDGRVVDEFVGVQPRSAIDQFLAGLLPSQADLAVRSGDEQSLRDALDTDPRHLEARLTLGRLLLARGATGEAVEVLRLAEHDPVGAGLLTRAELAHDPLVDPEAAAALAALDNDPEQALEQLIDAITTAPPERRERLRRVLIGVFGELGQDDPLVQRYRRRLATALY